jgi:hypothetical protein
MSKQYMTISNGETTITIRTNSEHAIKSAIKKLEGDFIGGSVKSISIKGSVIKYTYTDAPQSWGYWQSTSTSHVTIVENTFEVEQVVEVVEAPAVEVVKAPAVEVVKAPAVEVVAEQVEVKTEQGIVTVDIIAAATVEAVAEQVATDAYTAGCDAKFFAKTHAARIAKSAGTALTTEVKHLITTVTRRTVDQLDSALMA